MVVIVLHDAGGDVIAPPFDEDAHLCRVDGSLPRRRDRTALKQHFLHRAKSHCRLLVRNLQRKRACLQDLLLDRGGGSGGGTVVVLVVVVMSTLGDHLLCQESLHLLFIDEVEVRPAIVLLQQ